MLAYTTYSEAGGVGKTTLAASCAAAHQRAGHDVLVVDLDPQYGSISHLLDVGSSRTSSGDTIVQHLIDRPRGPFEELIETAENGVDVVPSHNMLERLEELLTKSAEIAEHTDESFDEVDRLRQVLAGANVHEDYDILIVDPPATPGPHLKNAIAATRSLLVPVELSGKGEQSVVGLEDLVEGLEEEIDASVGVLAVVPNRVSGTSVQQEFRETVEEFGYELPVEIAERDRLFGDCWDVRCDPWTLRDRLDETDRRRPELRDYEQETLAKLEELANHLVAVAEGNRDGAADTDR